MKKLFLAIAFLCASGTLFSMELPEKLEVKRIVGLPNGPTSLILKDGRHIVVHKNGIATIMQGLGGGNLEITVVPRQYLDLIAEKIKEAQKAQKIVKKRDE